MRSEAMRGHWEFEQRLLNSVEGEAAALAAARQLRHQLRRWGGCVISWIGLQLCSLVGLPAAML